MQDNAILDQNQARQNNDESKDRGHRVHLFAVSAFCQHFKNGMYLPSSQSG